MFFIILVPSFVLVGGHRLEVRGGREDGEMMARGARRKQGDGERRVRGGREVGERRAGERQEEGQNVDGT